VARTKVLYRWTTIKIDYAPELESCTLIMRNAHSKLNLHFFFAFFHCCSTGCDKLGLRVKSQGKKRPKQTNHQCQLAGQQTNSLKN